MNVLQATIAWGCSRNAVINRCIDGRIPGAHKEMTPYNSNPVWIIPDGTERPKDMGAPRGGIKKDATVKLGSKGICDPVKYVWDHQGNATIGELAKKLGVSTKRVIELYDEGFARFLHKEGENDE